MGSQVFDKSEKAVSAMFDGISQHYDRFNHEASIGQDRRWTGRLVSEVDRAGAREVLDVACGTGETTIALYRKGFNVTGIDISEKMLSEARRKISEIPAFGIEADKFPGHAEKTAPTEKPGRTARYMNASSCLLSKPEVMYANAESLPFEDSRFDAVTVAYGVRNFDRLDRCLQEIRRVIRPGGHIFVMEFAIPRDRLWRGMYRFYKKNIMRGIGKRLTGSGEAFDYLSGTVETFPQYDSFCSILEKNGFTTPSHTPLTGGIAVIYKARK